MQKNVVIHFERAKGGCWRECGCVFVKLILKRMFNHLLQDEWMSVASILLVKSECMIYEEEKSF